MLYRGVMRALPAIAAILLYAATASAGGTRAPKPPPGATATRPAPKRLRPKADYTASLRRATRALAKRKAPAVVDLSPSLKTIVIPDVHARTDYLTTVLKQRDPETGATYAQLLRAKKLQVVVVGDGMHSEGRAEARWLEAEANPNGSAMRREAGESLGTMKQIMDFKAKYPDHFHYLKGNHDNILDRNRGGDFSVVKYTNKGEGRLLRDFLSAEFGPDFVAQYAKFEKSLPLVAVGKQLVVSHSGPEDALPRAEIEKRTGRVVSNFTWTDLTHDSKRQARIVDQQLDLLGQSGGVYIAGHRQTGKRPYRRQGPFVQVNSEERMRYVVVDPTRPFVPKKGVRDASNE